jgi:hypothetical protein
LGLIMHAAIRHCRDFRWPRASSGGSGFVESGKPLSGRRGERFWIPKICQVVVGSVLNSSCRLAETLAESIVMIGKVLARLSLRRSKSLRANPLVQQHQGQAQRRHRGLS